MGFPLFRFTLSNNIEGSLAISEPGGWDSAKMVLNRNEEYSSLVELYDQPLLFYGDDGINNGGIDYIRNIEQTQGIDAQIDLLIEISQDDATTYETCFEGILDLETVKEIDFYKLEIGVTRNDFWQKFINRKATPVDLASAVDLDGDARTVINPVTIQLPSQKMFNRTTYENADPLSINGNANGTDAFQRSAQLGMPSTLSEIKDSFNILFTEVNSLVTDLINVIEVKELGDIEFTINSIARIQANSTQTIDQVNATIAVRKNNEVALGFTSLANPLSTSCDESLVISGSNVITNVNVGDLIYLYVIWGVSLSASGNTAYEFSVENTTVEFSQNSFTPDTDCEGFFIHEAGNSITDRIIGRDGTLYSEYLGNTLTQIQSYSDDGCGSRYAVTRGLNVRGYTLTEKPFFMSFDTWWNGINPILNLGLGYEVLGSPEMEVLRIEEKEFFFNDTPSIEFDFVNFIERSYDPKWIFKSIEMGYDKWSAESASGVDDPQTKRIYSTRFKTVGREIKILSKFIAASLAIEQTRRNRIEQGKDWRLDEDVMIIAMVLDGSPEFQPELDENFSSITNLLNAETRYNIRLSVARNFERWKNYFNGCLQWYVGEDYKFASGEGNFDMTSQLFSDDCEAVEASPEPIVNEKGDIEVTDDYFFMPIVYNFEHPLTWEEYKTIRDNRNNAIGISRTDTDHEICFIMNMEYEVTHGKANFTVMKKQ